MKLTVIRHTFDNNSTIGSLSIDGVFFCYTLEDKVRENEAKVYGETAIPYGEFEVAITYSEHFQRMLPLLMQVAGFEGVRIHWGNKAKDTDGCILVGATKGQDFIGNSIATFQALYDRLYDAWKAGERITISIEKGGGVDIPEPATAAA